MNPEPEEIYVDSSAMKTMYCRRAYQLRCLKGWVPKAIASPLIFGKATHTFVSIKSCGADHEVAAREAMKYYFGNIMGKDPTGIDTGEASKLSDAMASFYEPTYGNLLTPNEPKKSVEIFFKVPCNWVRTEKATVFFVGTLDRLAHDVQNDMLVAYDWKTSRKYGAERVLVSYETSIQFIFYYWILKKFGKQFIPVEWHKYLDEGKFAVCPVPVMLSMKPIRWVRGPYLRFDNVLNEFEQELQRIVETVLTMHYENCGTDSAPLVEPSGIIADACPNCDYKHICFRAPGLTIQQVLDGVYIKKPYDPSSF